jgi:hypothetical protein
MANNKYISPFVEKGNKFRSADKTSLDLTNPSPAGGPINSPQYNYSHTYTPANKYLDNFQAEASNNSAFGTEGDEVLNNSIFEKTELDIENTKPLGGPNRTNIPNIPNGEYVNVKTGNIYGESPYPGGTLKTTDGKDYKTVIQQWNKKNTYLNSLKPENQILTPVKSNNTKPLPLPTKTQELIKQIPADIGSGNQFPPDLISK